VEACAFSRPDPPPTTSAELSGDVHDTSGVASARYVTSDELSESTNCDDSAERRIVMSCGFPQSPTRLGINGSYKDIMRRSGWSWNALGHDLKQAIRSSGWNPLDHARDERSGEPIQDAERLDPDPK
jgi:hypothetical protein